MFRLVNPLASAFRQTIAALLMVASNVSVAATLDGALAQWVTQQAGPELVKVLGNHPRFKGETLSVVTMRNGIPATTSTELNRALEDAITHQLLKQSQVRVSWRAQSTRCGAPKAVPYLLGVDIKSISRNRATVNIAVVDVEENIWVPGVHLRWQGQLSRDQLRALKTRVARSATGTIDRPLPADSASEIGQRLFEQLRCAFPNGIDGPLLVQTNNDQGVHDISQDLRERLHQSVQFEAAPNAELARWHLLLNTNDAIGGSAGTRLDVNLEETGGDHRQQVASVFVSGLASGTLATAQQAVETDAPEPPPPWQETTQIGNQPLLSELLQNETGPCPNNFQRQCASVELEILQPSYLLVFRTQNGDLTAGQCKGNATRSKALRRRYRLPLDPDTTTGLYVVATADRAVAQRLQKQIRRAPGNCGSASGSTTEWLQRFSRYLEDIAPAIEWRAIHVGSETELKFAER